MKKEVDVFIPCSIDQFCPETGFDLIDLIESLGYKAVYRQEQTCCGRILYDNGNWQRAKTAGEKFIETFPGNNPVVGCSSSCIGYFKTKCANLFYNTSNHNSYKSLADRMMDITEFIHYVKPDCDLQAEFPFKVFLHNNCHSLNEYNLEQEVRLILSKVQGLTLVNQEGNNFCCGWGSGMELHNKAVSDELARHKAEYALQCGAEYITSTDTSCLLHIQNYISAHKLNLKTIHIVSLLRYSSKNNNGK
ncbi:MAG: (Fe-S)-binding protein [Bacteroidales bacterium]|nr:(Fe-S)-binding protein [Bacteroidales bacterium]MBP3254833.1 (Fe-S)-binding protein [Bacteroidales bacterium]